MGLVALASQSVLCGETLFALQPYVFSADVVPRCAVLILLSTVSCAADFLWGSGSTLLSQGKNCFRLRRESQLLTFGLASGR